MHKYCLDTNIVILLAGIYKEGSKDSLKQKKLKEKLLKVNISHLCINEIIKLEIQNSQYNYETKQGKSIPYSELEEYQKGMLKIFRNRNKVIEQLECYPLNKEAMNVYKKTNFVNKLGQKDHCDFLIASICIASDLILITDNEKHFREIDGLKFENWTQ